METTRQTKKVAFCCPRHGILNAAVEYISLELRDRMLVDVPVMYCQKCEIYYTPCTDILKKYDITYNGRPVDASVEHINQKAKKLEVRLPYSMNFSEWSVYSLQQRIEKEQEQLKQEQLRQEAELRKRKAQQERMRLQKEKNKQYIDTLNEVSNDSIILTNKPCFVRENKCPQCQSRTLKEHVKIVHDRSKSFLLANLKRCTDCNAYYVTPDQFYKFKDKAYEKIHGDYPHPFIRPSNIELEYTEAWTHIFIPREKINYEKYNRHYIPTRDDTYYDMSDEEYNWLKSLYFPDFPVKLRPRSFLGEAGYSTTLTQTRRHNILAKCVKEFGKSRVINQLKTNMNFRLKQKNGAIRYANAINVWLSDIGYVENTL